jgi:uncharacterized phiE125 gp8 family phage protein
VGLTLITPASGTLVTLAEAKLWAKVEGVSEDSLVQDLIAQAEAKVAEYTGLALGEQTWKLVLDAFSDAIELPRGPVLAVAAADFTYVDSGGASQQVDPALYTLDLVSSPAWIVRDSDASWPATLDAVNVVSVQFTTGFTVATLPASIKRAVLTLVARWYDDRINCDVPAGVLDALAPYRQLWICA